MSYGIQMRVWGDYALFTRAEMKTERVTYDVMTPSAARGMLEAVYWHPGLRWTIDRIYVCKPIQYTTIRRNEVKSKIPGSSVLQVMNGSKELLYLSTSDDIVQRSSLILRDVEYVIAAHFDLTGNANSGDNPGKFKDIVRRRLQKGACWHTPYLGTREFPARFSLCEDQKIETAYTGERDLGYMLYDLDFSNPEDIRPMFFHAVLRDGVLDLTDCKVIR